MVAAALPENEVERLKALIDLCVLDTAPEAALDAIVQCAAMATGAPIALVSLVDQHRQWFKARFGLGVQETPRDYAFCSHAILGEEPLIVPDSDEDPRFYDNPLVTGAPFVKAYLGAPIHAPGGQRIGTVCAIDQRPHAWTDREVTQLQNLAALVSALLQHRTAALRSEDLAAQVCALSAAMAEKERLLEQIADVAQIGGWGFDIASQTGHPDRKVRALLGLPGEGAVSLSQALARFGADGQAQFHAAAQQAAAAGVDWDLDLPFMPADGPRRWMRIRGRPVYENGRPARFVGAMQDVTAHHEAEETLQNALSVAEAATAAKGAFLANMSHEIRTPLNGVLGLADTLARTDLDPRQAEMVTLIRQSGQVLRRLLTDILDMSKIEAGKLDLVAEPFDLRETLETTADLMRVRADEKGLRFTVSYGVQAQGVFEGDPVRLRQIVANLCHNAIKFTPSGSVQVSVEIADAAAGPAMLQVSVQDTGVGFDEETAARLFQRFEQANAEQAFGGAGLGLSICRGLAELMGGRLTATSTPGLGSCFVVRLPLPRAMSLPAYAASRAAQQAPPAKETSLPSGLVILLAEDHPVNRRLVQLMLEPFGVTLQTAADGAEALALFKRARFDLVLMDMQMPVLDGLEATRAIRALEAARGLARTPILMLSANAMAAHVAAADAAGCDGHVAKPLSLPDLVHRMRQALLGAGRESPPRPACGAQAC